MQPFDVAVVGSGPAGAATALRLARDGVRVALIDEKTFPRDKLCGEYLNLGAIRELHALGLAERIEARAMPLRGMRLFAHGEVSSFPIAPAAWSIARTVLDTELRDAALEAGAQPLRGRLRAIEVGSDGVALTVRDREGIDRRIDARYAVGADGMHSAVARSCGLTTPARSEHFAVGGHHPEMPMAHWMEIFMSRRGYVAINPLDAHAANAIFVMKRDDLARAGRSLGDELERFSVELTGGTYVTDDARFAEHRRGIGPLAHRTLRPACERVLLVGDAAAFLDPFTGHGVFLGLTGARFAARAIARSLGRPQRESEAWSEYARSLRGALRERELIALMMRTLVTWNFATRRAARALQRRPDDFAFLIDAVCAKASANPLKLAAAVGAALR